MMMFSRNNGSRGEVQTGTSRSPLAQMTQLDFNCPQLTCLLHDSPVSLGAFAY